MRVSGMDERMKLLPAYLLWLVLPGLLLVREANPVWWSSLSVRGLISTAELLLCISIWPVIRNQSNPVSARIILITSLWLGWCLLSTLLSDTMWQGLPRWSELVIHCIFLLMLYRYLHTYRQATSILLAAQLSVLILIMSALVLTWLSAGSPRQYNWVNDAPFFNNIRHLGFLAVMIIPLGYYLLEQNKSRFLHVQSLLVLITGWTLIFWLGGRGAFISLLITTLIYLYWYRQRWLLIFTVIVTAALLSQLFLVNNPSMNLLRLIPMETDKSLNDISSGRLEIYIKAIAYWWKYAPVTGMGADHFRFIIPDILRPHIIQPHSFPVQLLISYGIPGAALACWLGYRFFSYGFRQSPISNRILLLPVIAGVLHSITDGVFYHAYSIMLAITFIALCAGNWPAEQEPHPLSAGSRWLPSGLSSAAALILVPFLIQIHLSTRSDLSLTTILAVTHKPLFFRPDEWIASCKEKSDTACLKLLTDTAVEKTDNPCYYYRLSDNPDSGRLDYYCHAQ